jgi:hypothetical protein
MTLRASVACWLLQIGRRECRVLSPCDATGDEVTDVSCEGGVWVRIIDRSLWRHVIGALSAKRAAGNRLCRVLPSGFPLYRVRCCSGPSPGAGVTCAARHKRAGRGRARMRREPVAVWGARPLESWGVDRREIMNGARRAAVFVRWRITQTTRKRWAESGYQMRLTLTSAPASIQTDSRMSRTPHAHQTRSPRQMSRKCDLLSTDQCVASPRYRG